MLKKGVITAFEPILGYRAGAENMVLLAAQARIIGSQVPFFSNWLISAKLADMSKSLADISKFISSTLTSSKSYKLLLLLHLLYY